MKWGSPFFIFYICASMNVKSIIAETFNVGEENIHDETVIIELEEWDSMTHMFFITRLEKEFGVELTGEEIAKMQSVKAINQVLDSKR